MKQMCKENFKLYEKIYHNSTHIDPPTNVLEKLKKWDDGNKHELRINRPSWEQTFLTIAHTVKKRSHDSQTQCGCVITDQFHRIIGTGYNGWPKNIPDDLLPNVRPEKYQWMLHSELNAIFNCEHRPEDGIVYVTGHPCLHCFLCMYQIGISKIIYDENHSINMIGEQKDSLDVFKWLVQDKIVLQPYDYKEE